MAREIRLQRGEVIVADSDLMFKLVSGFANDNLDRLDALISQSGSQEEINKLARILTMSSPIIDIVLKLKPIIHSRRYSDVQYEHNVGKLYQYGDFVRYASTIQYLDVNYAVVGAQISKLPPIEFSLHGRLFDMIPLIIEQKLEKLEMVSKQIDTAAECFTILDSLFDSKPIKLQIRTSSSLYCHIGTSYDIGEIMVRLIDRFTRDEHKKLSAIFERLKNQPQFHDIMEKYNLLMRPQ